MTGSPGCPDPDRPSALLALMARLEPALAPEAVLAALDQAAARPDGRRRIAAAVTDQPELLTGEGARAPIPRVVRFISALTAAGATAVVEPPCPRCGRSATRSRDYGSAEGAGAKPARCAAAAAGK